MSQDDPQSAAITVLVCDDHRILSDALGIVLSRHPGIDLIAVPLTRGEDAVSACLEHHPAVVLMDIELAGDMDGLAATRRIKQELPQTHVVVMTAHEDDRLLISAIEAGASGFLFKTEGMAEVIETIEAAAEGRSLVDPHRLSRALRTTAQERDQEAAVRLRFDQLTTRENEILQLLALGLRNDDIARRLHIGTSTVHSHVKGILAKLKVRSRLEAVSLAVRHGAVSFGPEPRTQ